MSRSGFHWVLLALSLTQGCKQDNPACDVQYGNACRFECSCPHGYACVVVDDGHIRSYHSYCEKPCESDAQCGSGERCTEQVSTQGGGAELRRGTCEIACDGDDEQCPELFTCGSRLSYPDGESMRMCTWLGYGQAMPFER